MNKRTTGWLRVEPADRGDFVVLDPYVPRRASVDEDRETPRIPVCDDVGKCLVAVTTLHLRERLFVYRASRGTNGRRRLALDYESPRKLVPDWEETEEVWITEAVGFEKVGEIEVRSGILREPEVEWRWLPRGRWRIAKP